jgi:hypothetical protein
VKIILLLVAALLTRSVAEAADLSVADLPRIHDEYKANQARWAREFLDKTFAATLTLAGVSNVFSNENFYVTFLESPSESWPGVACRNAPASDFLVSKNKGESIFFRGVVKDHSIGTLDLRDCEFFDSEKAASDADAKRLATEAEARANVDKQAAADAEAQRLATENAALEESTRAASATPSQKTTQSSLDTNKAWCAVLTSRSDPESKALAAANCKPFSLQTLALPVSLNDTLRNMIQKTGKRCNAITDHVWITPEHVSVMCDRRLRAAFIHEADSWRFGRPNE